jgi:hypothetical protein
MGEELIMADFIYRKLDKNRKVKTFREIMEGYGYKDKPITKLSRKQAEPIKNVASEYDSEDK